jgi:hypothetical protein
LFEDVGTYQTAGPFYREVNVQWHTSYDASRMQLRAYHQRTGVPDALVWIQSVSGDSIGVANIWYPHALNDVSWALQDGESVVFRVVAVPEPGSIQVLALCALALAASRRRRQP